MILILIRHGEAVHDLVDPKRPLTVRGREEVRRSAGALKKAGVSAKVFYHSSKLRARETAEILREVLNPGGRMEEKKYLAPNDSVDRILADIQKMAEDSAIAGHMPFLANLAESLVSPADRTEPFSFPTGGAVVLRKDGKRWIIL